MAKFTAGAPLTRGQLDNTLSALGLKLGDAMKTAMAVAGVVGELTANPSDPAAPNGDLANLDPAAPYTDDEVEAIIQLVTDLQPVIAAMQDGTALAAMSPSLAEQAAKFTKLAGA
jgi:hypothetical protein